MKEPTGFQSPKPEISVTHISTSDIKGGAASAAYRQHVGLLNAGVDSKILALIKNADDDSVLPFDYGASLLKRLLRRLQKIRINHDFNSYRSTRPDGLELFSDDRVHLGRQVMDQIPHTDIVNLHWYMGFLDFSLLPVLTMIYPVVVSMHDEWAFTGGCHYDLGCDAFLTKCGHCPQLGSSQQRDLSTSIFARKAAVLSKCDHTKLIFISPSRWLQQKAQKSALLKNFAVEFIPYGIDTKQFKPIVSTKSFRFGLGCSDTDFLVLFVASGLGLPRKGYAFLKQALEMLPPSCRVKLITVGGGQPESPANAFHLHMGSIGDQQALSTIYTAANVFIMPSTDEAFGLTALEAMACGTAVIGFRSGICADAITNGVNGYVLDVGDVEGLAKAICGMANHPNQVTSMGHAARNYAERELSNEINAARYVKIYKLMIQRYTNSV